MENGLLHVVALLLKLLLLLCAEDSLLRNAAEFVDKVMEIDEELCTQWSCPELVLAVMEAVKQIGYLVYNLADLLLDCYVGRDSAKRMSGSYIK